MQTLLESPPHFNANDHEDVFVKVSVKESNDAPLHMDREGVYKDWIEKASSERSRPEIFNADLLRIIYPKHSFVMTSDYRIVTSLLAFPRAFSEPMTQSEIIKNIQFIPLARNDDGVQGVLYEIMKFGAFRTRWDGFEFIMFMVLWDMSPDSKSEIFLLHDGGEEPARDLILACGGWYNELHEEIWVYDQGWWRKDHSLWIEVQKADWKDVILKEEFKAEFRQDIDSFFSSEELYKKLAIPWKRGIIMHGPPGNGKTISIKAVMKEMDAKGHMPLYIKSFRRFGGEEAGMADVFDHARQMAPCVVVFEDIDSLINDGNRSFFLNQLDGLEGNDGLLLTGTTNHYERLDPGLSSRPSRFDRKYHFDDPDREERALYAKYWQGKLKDNEDVAFPDSLVNEIADLTNGFSFAYLKEAFVSSLVLVLQEETKKPFGDIIKEQIRFLRKELNKDLQSVVKVPPVTYVNPLDPVRPEHERWALARGMAVSVATSLGRSFHE